MDDLSVVLAAAGDAVADHGRFGDRSDPPTRVDFSEEGETHEEPGAGESRQADPRMKGKADHQVQRYPGQVEQRRRAAACQKRPDLVQVPQWLLPVAGNALSQGLGYDMAEGMMAQFFVEARSDPREDPTPDAVK